MIRKSVVFAGLFSAALFITCKDSDNPVSAADAKGTLKVSYQLNSSEKEGITLTRTRVVWLEDAAGTYLRTLLVTEWLSSSGSTEDKMEIACPSWNKKAKWNTAPKAEVDAVTKATDLLSDQPEIFPCVDSLTADIAGYKLKPGTYYCCVEYTTQSMGNSIMLKAPIAVGGAAAEGAGTAPVYTPGPGKIPAGEVISGLKVKYVP